MSNLGEPVRGVVHDNIDSLSGPEKLVICVDSVCINRYFPMMLRNFLEIKTQVNRHEIALALLSGNDVNFLCDFDADVKSVCSRLWDRSKFDHSPLKQLDLDKIFSQVYQFATPYKDADVVFRVIIFYARTDCVPSQEINCPLLDLRKDLPHFTLDVLYMPRFSENCAPSRKRDERSNVEQVFKAFIEICDGNSYIFGVEQPADVGQCLLKLLAHPALRRKQDKSWLE